MSQHRLEQVMRTLGGAVLGAMVLAAIVGATIGAEARGRCGCACVLLLLGMFIGGGFVAEEKGDR